MKDKEKKDGFSGLILWTALVTALSILGMLCKMLIKIWEGMWR